MNATTTLSPSRYRAASLKQVWGGRIDAVLATAHRALRAIPPRRHPQAASVTPLPARQA
jgi:hypothetical protein